METASLSFKQPEPLGGVLGGEIRKTTGNFCFCCKHLVMKTFTRDNNEEIVRRFQFFCACTVRTYEKCEMSLAQFA